MFRAEIQAQTPEEAIDKCEEKLKVQIEKYKSKFVKNDMHSNSRINPEDFDKKGEFDDLI